MAQRQDSPLTHALAAVPEAAWRQPLERLELRTLRNEMGQVLETLHRDGQYRILTHRGVPTFLLLPLNVLPAFPVQAARGSDTSALDLPRDPADAHDMA